MGTKNICGGFNNTLNKAKQTLLQQRADFFVNEMLALELVITVCFQQVKKIIRSERKQLVRDQYLHEGKHNTFLPEHTNY